MAAVTHEDARAVTTNAATYPSNSFTPALDDLLIVFARVGATVAAGTCTDSQGLGFTKVDHATFRTSLDRIYCFVANNLAAASAMTVTMDVTGDNGDGSVVFVAAVAGMTRKGLQAVRQSAKQENQASGGTPAPAFASAALTGNPCLGCVGNSTNPAGLTAPSGWTEPAGGDTGYATPTSGSEYVFRNSGFTGTTVTWGSTSASAFGSLIVELDSSAPPESPAPRPIIAPSLAAQRASRW